MFIMTVSFETERRQPRKGKRSMLELVNIKKSYDGVTILKT